MDGFVDLHAHSTASDGARTPTEGAQAAHAAGLSAYALTDHDTLAGIAEAQAAAQALGVRLIPGVELSVHHQGHEIHMLGLHIRDVDALQRALERIRAQRYARAERIVERLNQHGVPLTFDAVLAAANGGAIGRPHVARALVSAGHVKDAREAFDRWLAAGRPAYVEKDRVDASEGISLVHRAGGIAVLAHPAEDATKDVVAPLVAVGLDGVEVRHPSHSADDERRALALVQEHRLVPSGGSDWHGAAQGARTLGVMKVPAEWLERQEARVAQRRGENVA